MSQTSNIELTVEDKKMTEVTETSIRLSVKELQLMTNIISVFSKRGAIEASELSTVGQFYDKLVQLLKSHNEQKQT